MTKIFEIFFDKMCLKSPENNFKQNPKLIFEKKIFFRPQVVPWENDKKSQKVRKVRSSLGDRPPFQAHCLKA